LWGRPGREIKYQNAKQKDGGKCKDGLFVATEGTEKDESIRHKSTRAKRRQWEKERRAREGKREKDPIRELGGSL
jgi:hypothetical protein